LHATFDVYESSAQSDAMAAFLGSVPTGDIVVIVAADAVDRFTAVHRRTLAAHVEEEGRVLTYTPPHRTAALVSVMQNSFGAADFSLSPLVPGWRDSYAFIGVKDGTQPPVEVWKEQGTGAALAMDTIECPGISPNPTLSPGSCIGDLGLEGVSAGFEDFIEDGALSTLAVSYGGVPFDFDDSWMDRGLNIVAFAGDSHGVLASGTFDFFARNPSTSSDIIVFLNGIPAGSIVAILAMDAIDHWSDSNIDTVLLNYMEAVFGGTKFGAWTSFRDSYILFGVKGVSTGPAAEETSVAGTGALTLTAMFLCGATSPPSSMPTHVPTALRMGYLGDLTLQAVSAGFEDPPGVASLTVLYDGLPSTLSFEWFGRGMNVVVFDGTTHALLTANNFDAYEDVSSSYDMQGFLSALPDGAVVVILGMDALDHWETPVIDADLIAYVSSPSVFGATKFGAWSGYRDSYALIGVKGVNGPVFEETSAAGTGAVTTTAIISLTQPSPMPTPLDYSDGTTLMLEASSAGFSDGNAATLSVSYGRVDSGYDDSWMGRGYNVVSFTAQSHVARAQAVFDLLASASDSDAMLSFLQACPEEGVIVVLAKDATDTWNKMNRKADLKAYMSTTFGAALFGDVQWRDSYAFIGAKYSPGQNSRRALTLANPPLFEERSAVNSGPVSGTAWVVSTAPTPTPTAQPTFVPTFVPTFEETPGEIPGETLGQTLI